mmetsp:Transcript_46755/g.149219  ORF Transcript_46755/g.149219 Transcript_46755/m.149219 type:complete len:124 (-) Transcript_46755:6-377(-)
MPSCWPGSNTERCRCWECSGTKLRQKCVPTMGDTRRQDNMVKIVTEFQRQSQGQPQTQVTLISDDQQHPSSSARSSFCGTRQSPYAMCSRTMKGSINNLWSRLSAVLPCCPHNLLSALGMSLD